MIAAQRLIIQPRPPAAIRVLFDAAQPVGRAECECGHFAKSVVIGCCGDPDGGGQAGVLQPRPVLAYGEFSHV